MKGYKGKIKKKITIKLVGDAEKAFNGLNRIVGEQRSQGITSSKDITLLNAINRIFDIIVNNPFYGENAKKVKISFISGIIILNKLAPKNMPTISSPKTADCLNQWHIQPAIFAATIIIKNFSRISPIKLDSILIL